MADRYWVASGEGPESWHSTFSWASSSGGFPGESIPGSGDNVFFDSVSGVGCTCNNGGGNTDCNNITFSSYGGDFETSATIFRCYGNFTVDESGGGE